MPLSRAATAGKDEIVAYLLGIKGVSPDRSTGEKVTVIYMGKNVNTATYIHIYVLYNALHVHCFLEPDKIS